MIIFLYGPDSYRRREKLNEIISKHREKNLACRFFDFSVKIEDEFLRLKEFCAIQSIFKETKLAVLENCLKAKEISKKFIVLLKENIENKDIVLAIISDEKPLKDFHFLLEKPILSQEFEILKSKELEAFIKKEAQKRELILEKDAAGFLAQVFQEDTWGLITELDKLALLDNKNINLKYLKEIVEYNQPVSFPEFFSAIRNLSSGRILSQRIIALETLLINQEEPAKIFNFLASLKSNPLPLIQRFADYDVAVKSGKMDYDEVLVDFALN